MEGQLRDLSRTLSDRLASSTYGKPVSLNLHQKVFLSHSGKDKNFVGFLYKELCRRYSSDTIAFFDVESLPKATPISMENILEEARSSKLGVLVLTEDFFMKTPNPMLELEAFVASEVQLLPLFFGMSVDEFKQKSRRAKWEEQWRTWSAKQLGGSSVEETIKKWRAALDIVNKFSGLEYCKEAKTEPKYIDRIVKKMTRIIRLLIPLSEEGVRGKDRLCQIVDDMYKECASKRLSVNRTTQATSTHASDRMVDVVGIYGFAGTGKTTLCRCLHDFYFGEFNGKVCYLDLGWLPSDQAASISSPSNEPFSKNMKHVLSTLTDYISDNPYILDDSQVRHLLRDRLLVLTYPVFLAIDINILHLNLDQLEARQEEVKFYLSCEFPKGSKIFITSRSHHVLENITIPPNRFSAVIKYMPPLLFEEARDIFVHEMLNLGISITEDEVNEYVKMCTFESPSWSTKHYHPWILRSLAGVVKNHKRQKKSLRMLRSEGIVHTNDVLEKVFKMLNFAFMILSKEEQKMFLDFALFYNFTDYGPTVYAWIEQFYSQNTEHYFCQFFLLLKELCFIEKYSEKPPKLVMDFCLYKVTQGEYEQYYEVVEANTCWRDVIPRSVRYISISGCGDSPDTACAAELDLRKVEALEVLHLVGIKHTAVVRLSSTTCAHLRSLIVRVPPGTSLHFVTERHWPCADAPIHQALRRTLFCLELQGNVCFMSLRSYKISSWLESNACNFWAMRQLVLAVADGVAVIELSSSILTALTNLEVVSLSKLPFQSIDVTTCSKLEELSLTELSYLRSISGLDKLTSFKHLSIRRCKQLPTLTIGAYSDHLITDCTSLNRISLCTYPGADSRNRTGPRLGVSKCPSLKNVDGLLQYTGDFNAGNGVQLAETFVDLLQAAAVDSSICKAKVQCLDLKGDPAGLAGVCKLQLRDAQHIGLLLSALTKAHPKHLQYLDISCKAGGDCGCDKDAPQFGPFPSPNRRLYLGYHCPQVRDLGSRALADLECCLRVLDLTGCTSVEKWPDFATMAGLKELELSYTSLKEWPTSLVPLLGDFMWGLDMKGCKQLPAEELMKGITAIRHEMPLPHGHLSCITTLLLSLLADLKAGERDRCSVVGALDSYYQELVALLHPSSFSTGQVDVILEILYHVWFGEGVKGEAAHASLPDVIRNKLSRLLCSEKTMSIPFHNWRGGMSALLDRASDYGLPRQEMMVRRLMGVALIGGASIGWFKAAVNDDLLKDSFIPFLKWFTHAPTHTSNSIRYLDESFEDMCGKKLRERVGEAACNMARVPTVAIALGADFVERLEAQVHGGNI